MGKLLIFLSFLCLLTLQIISYAFPQSDLLWLASNTGSFELARNALMIILFGLLVTNPPRHLYFRAFTGIASISTLVTTAYLTYNNRMNILDILAFALVGVVMGITALEINHEGEEVVDLEALRQAKRVDPAFQE